MIKEHDTVSDTLGLLGTLFMGISTAKILDFLLAYRDFEYSEADIARKSGLSARQIYRALPILVEGGLVYHSDTKGRKKMYRLDKNSEAVHHLERMVFALIDSKNRMSSIQSTEVEVPDMTEPLEIT